MSRRIWPVVRRPGTIVVFAGGVGASALAVAVSPTAGLVAVIITIAAAQIVHQDQVVRLLGRAEVQRRDAAVVSRLDDLAASLDTTIGLHSATVSSTLAEHIDELRLRMQQAYGHRERLANQLQSVASISSLVDDGVGLPPLRGWALSPDNAEAIFRLVRTVGAEYVVELGSGSSTALLAVEAEQRGVGHVTALEHHPGYAAQTNTLLAQFGAPSRAEVITCPLTPVDVDQWTIPWYDLSGIDLPTSIDVLIVDGPPGDTHEFARLPAELLFPRVAVGGFVVLDDANRESALVERWSSRPDFVVSDAPKTEKGIAILQRVSSK